MHATLERLCFKWKVTQPDGQFRKIILPLSYRRYLQDPGRKPIKKIPQKSNRELVKPEQIRAHKDGEAETRSGNIQERPEDLVADTDSEVERDQG